MKCDGLLAVDVEILRPSWPDGLRMTSDSTVRVFWSVVQPGKLAFVRESEQIHGDGDGAVDADASPD